MEVVGKIHSLESFGTVDGPGVRFVIFTQGCPLRCQYCHNPDTWALRDQPKTLHYTPQAMMDEVLRYKSYIKSGGVTVTGGEPLLQPAFLTAFFQLCRQQGIHTALDTSGYIFNEKTKEVLDAVDLVLLDIKTLDKTLHTQLTGVKQDSILRFLDYLQTINKPTWIRHVVVPGLTDNDEQLERLAQYIQPYTNVEKVELMGYHSMGVFKYEELGLEYPLKGVEPLSKERLDNAKRIFRNHNFTVL